MLTQDHVDSIALKLFHALKPWMHLPSINLQSVLNELLNKDGINQMRASLNLEKDFSRLIEDHLCDMMINNLEQANA